MNRDIADIRRDYQLASLDEATTGKAKFKSGRINLFIRWQEPQVPQESVSDFCSQYR